MTPKRFFFILLGVTILLGAAFFGVISYGRTLILAEGESLKELRTENAALERRTTALSQAKRYIKDNQELETITKSVVPQDKDQARTVLELVAIAREAGINVTGINFPQSALGEVAKKSSKKTAVTDPNLTQLTPLDSPKGVYSMEIRLDTDPSTPVRYSQLVDFLSRLENNRRTSHVTNIQITPDTVNRSVVSFNVTLTSYIKP